jgi:hypothetical protein
MVIYSHASKTYYNAITSHHPCACEKFLLEILDLSARNNIMNQKCYTYGNLRKVLRADKDAVRRAHEKNKKKRVPGPANN